MKNRIQISLYAASPARRSWLSSVAKNLERSTTKVIATLEARHHVASETATQILVADIATPAEATAFVRLVDRSPGAQGTLGSVALIDAPDAHWVETALGAGTNAIISREPNSDELRLAISAAEAGLILLHPSSARSLASRFIHPQVALHEDEDENEREELTARERQVLRLLGDGLGNKEIAARLAISEHTAKFHISSILGKLGAASRTEAVSLGIRRGLIPI